MSLVSRSVSALGKIGVVIAVAVVFLAGMFGTIYYSLRSPEVKVPDVVGKDVATGEADLDRSGLNMRRRAVRYSADAKPNTILDQSPHPGEIIKVGQTVAVVVSRSDAKEGDNTASSGADDASGNKNQNGENAGTSAATNTNENANDKPNRNTRNRNTNNSNNSNNNNSNRNANNRNANSNRTTNDRNSNSRNDNAKNTNDRTTNDRAANSNGRNGNGNANRSVNTSNTNRRAPILMNPRPNTNGNRGTPR